MISLASDGVWPHISTQTQRSGLTPRVLLSPLHLSEGSILAEMLSNWPIYPASII
ncbi:rCG38035 [Rattus norvegicus]|uniref:RCG38035 n=1 Tax=Rattus norvegicus TaxID=10116 RepID=A6IV33_RAT|nr:rCG38035 [Rattus norvegicus]